MARLSDVNDSMRSALSGTADSRSHTLARHRDILHDFTQVLGQVMNAYAKMAGKIDKSRKGAMWTRLEYWEDKCRDGQTVNQEGDQ